MAQMMCVRCKKRPAVVFVQRMDGGETKTEGYCLTCAKELGIKPVDDLMKQFGISDEDLENMEDRFSNFMQNGGAEAMQGLMGPNGDGGDDAEGGGDSEGEDGDFTPGGSGDNQRDLGLLEERRNLDRHAEIGETDHRHHFFLLKQLLGHLHAHIGLRLVIPFDQFDLAVAGVEHGEFHDLNQILLHVDDVIEAVTDHNAVGFYACRDRGRLLRPGRESREKKRYCKESFHRCLNSFINSAT